MHELSIAAAVVDVVERHAAGRRVSGVELQVGHLRQVVPGSLLFAFELLTQNTPLQGAQLHINHVAPRVRCTRCGAASQRSQLPLDCARCGSLEVELTAGEELLVEALELEEEPERERCVRISST